MKQTFKVKKGEILFDEDKIIIIIKKTDKVNMGDIERGRAIMKLYFEQKNK
jgi:hypothetical protein